MIENKDIIEAVDRIARSPDGQILYRYLQKTLCAVMAHEPHEGALRQFEGRRMFASELMGMMSKGIADSDRYAITFVRTASEPAARTRGAARRVTADTIVPGWDTPALGGGTIGPDPGSTGSTPGPVSS